MTAKTLKKTLTAATLLTAASVTAVVLHAKRGTDAPVVTTGPVTRGSVVRSISATGTLEARTTVQVGTQVSGTIQALNADFNSIVRKGQVLARLDPSLYQSAIEQALLDPTYPRTIRIVMNRGLSAEKFTSAIVEALEPRMMGQEPEK